MLLWTASARYNLIFYFFAVLINNTPLGFEHFDTPGEWNNDDDMDYYYSSYMVGGGGIFPATIGWLVLS